MVPPSGYQRREFLRAAGATAALTLSAGCSSSFQSNIDASEHLPDLDLEEQEAPDTGAVSGEKYRRHENGLHWHETPVRYVVGTSTYPDYLDHDAVTRAIRASFRAWNEVPDTKRVFAEPEFVDDLHAVTFENDVNEFVFEELRDDSLGRAFWRWSTATSRLLEVDIRLNPGRRWFVDESTIEDGTNAYDVQSVVMHELGHNALRDVTYAPDQTMYHTTSPGETKKRTLGEGDNAGWRAAYGSVE